MALSSCTGNPFSMLTSTRYDSFTKFVIIWPLNYGYFY